MELDCLLVKRLLLVFALIVCSVSIGWWADLFGHGYRELTIRSFGFALQLIGFGVVVLDLRGAALKHGIQTLPAVIKTLLTRKNVSVSVGTGAGTVSITGHGAAVTVTPANPTVEQRIQLLEQQQEAIRRDVDYPARPCPATAR